MPQKNKQEPFAFGNLVSRLGLGAFRRLPGARSKFVFANPVLGGILGYSSDEILEMAWGQLFVDPAKPRELDLRISEAGFCVYEEVRLKAKDKTAVTCLMSCRAVKDGRGRVLWIDGIVEEAAIHKKFEKDLLESRELFRLVFNNSAAAITVTDKEHRIIAWNPYAEKFLGMDKKDLFNTFVKELYPSAEWQRLQTLGIRQRGMLSDIETQVRRKDGSVLDVNLSVSVIKDSGGVVIGTIGIMNDITRQKTAERRIKESENKIRIILDNSAVAITLTDEQDRLVSWNRYAEQLLGFSREELYLKPVKSLYPAEEHDKIRSAEIRKYGSRHHLETRVLKKDGTLIDVDLSVNVLKGSNDQVIGSVGIMQDITEQKRFQQMLLQAKTIAEEANSAKSLFLANMSHEVRTPMNTILGMIDLTLDTEMSLEQRDNLSTAKDAADILLSLLNDIIDLSRVEAGKIQLEQIEMNIHNIVKSVCKGLSVLAQNKKLELAWDVDPAVPETLVGDPVRVRQVLVNLINNAIKFTFQGKIVTSVRVEGAEGDELELRFAVADEGIGIPKDKQNAIFDVFTQADPSTTRRFGGTGLGLSISKRLVEMMNGRIWVESEEFKGSTFSFTARLKTVPEKREVPAPAPDFAEPSGDKPLREIKDLAILLAEDNIVNQKIAARMLEKRGWKVKAVENGQAVLDLMAKEKFDLILMDAQMPIMDGFEATRLIREQEKATKKHIPIIALTARAMTADRTQCLQSGMDGYVSKPIDRQKLYEAIEQLF
ncbi:MAG: PAS domain S-box protein [Candidatus Omnitrophota bacterium]|nr:PAS domain S-box protein [Candidatus Omnitrophota bacterium]MDZ4243061.1 PAS domain S-box protein [Candidatus Omnitrophota bacterium]